MQALLQQLRSQSEKEIFVHRLQFEKEFSVYLELWKKALPAARAGIPFEVLSTAEDAPHGQHVKRLRDAYNELKDTIYDYRPFYAPQVYDVAGDLLAKLSDLYTTVADSTIFRDQARRREADAIMTAVNETYIPRLCDAIRVRLFPGGVNTELGDALTEVRQ